MAQDNGLMNADVSVTVETKESRITDLTIGHLLSIALIYNAMIIGVNVYARSKTMEGKFIATYGFNI